MAARDKGERRAIEADEAAQEHGPADVRPPRVATDYVHATHPDHGEDVVFVPGEHLPAWVPNDGEGKGRGRTAKR